MPTYSFKCEKCGHMEDKFFRSILEYEEPDWMQDKLCPECSEPDFYSGKYVTQPVGLLGLR